MLRCLSQAGGVILIIRWPWLFLLLRFINVTRQLRWEGMSYSMFHYKKIISTVNPPLAFNTNRIICLHVHGQMCSSVLLLLLRACFCFIILKTNFKFLLSGYLKKYSPNYPIYQFKSSLNAEKLQKRKWQDSLTPYMLTCKDFSSHMLSLYCHTD